MAAHDHARSKFSYGAPQIDNFKQHGLFGIEQDPVVTTLAIVNMIFRNDGKNHILEGNSFAKYLEAETVNHHPSAKVVTKQPPKGSEGATKVLMNPPFALEESNEKEYRFVQHGLDNLVEGGLLFSVLPISAMIEGGEVKEWRQNRLLGENTLVAVITFPPELFYPIGVHTLGIVVRKGMPHPERQNVLWARAIHDGYIKVKGVRRLATKSRPEPNDFERIAPLVQAFVRNPSFRIESQPEFIKASPIDFDDPLLELVPEAYLDSRIPTPTELRAAADQLVREAASLAIRFPELWRDNDGHK